jgi:hypothetical protein
MLNEEVFTLEEVSKHLRVPLDAVQQEVNCGRLRVMSVAGHLRVRDFDLAAYKDDAYAQAAPAAKADQPPVAARKAGALLMNLAPAPDFRHVWPDGKDETFVSVLEGIASLGDKEHHVKVGFTVRRSSGRMRSRSLVLVDRYPSVEFVAATDVVGPDDQMVSIIRDRNGKQVPIGATIPAEYLEMTVEPYRAVVIGPGATNGSAIICNANDIESMVKHALIRYRFRKERA